MKVPLGFAFTEIRCAAQWLPTMERWLRLWSESGKRRPDSLSISCKDDVVTLTAKCNGREISREVAFHEASSPAGEAVMRGMVEAAG